MALAKKYQEQLADIIIKHIPHCTIYLFGSRSTDKERPGSDADLALDSGKKIPHKTILQILIDIEDSTIPMSIDLVDLHSVSEKFKKEVLSEGIILHGKTDKKGRTL